MRNYCSGGDGTNVFDVVRLGAFVRGSGQGYEQIEHGVEEYGDGQDKAAGHQRDGHAFGSQEPQKRPHNPVCGAAIHHAFANDHGQGNHDADLAGRATKGQGHAANLLGQIARGQQTDDYRRGNQGNKSV